MTWPTYFNPAQALPVPDHAPLPWRPVLRHDTRQRENAPRGGLQAFGVAVDVWRDGVHLWRSWETSTGESLIDWTAAHLGDDVAQNYDDGLWGVPGVQEVADWPIPHPASVAPVYGLQAVADLLYTMPAIALRGDFTWPTPEGFETPPTLPVLRQRLARAEGDSIVAAFCEQGVSVRALVRRVEAASGKGGAPVPTETWHVALTRREVRTGTSDTDLGEREVTFEAPQGAKPNILARHAKAALEIPGWPGARKPKTLTWVLAKAPYQMTITGTVNQGVDAALRIAVACS